MKKIKIIGLSLIALALISSCRSSQSGLSTMVARMQVDEPIEGVCDNANIIAILPFPGSNQVAAIPSKTEEEIAADLNATVDFLKDNPNYEDKGMVGLIVNCKGELVRCQIDNKTKSPELDSQIVAVFATLKKWTPGSVNNKSVDTSVLYSFTIEGGKITL